MSVDIVRWTLDVATDRLDALHAHLSDDERERAAKFTREDPRRRFIAARGTLRERLAERLSAEPAELVFAYGPMGKPSVCDAPELHFNLAHSADLAICALADEPVGIDLERIRPMKNAQGLARRWFHPEEIARIENAADPLHEFFRTWTMKEAVLKLIGVGVGEALPKVLTPGGPNGGEATGLPVNEAAIRACSVYRLAVEDNFAASYAFATTYP
ncbi:MAG: 4'-phosphopantetheinyl transferase superfamily protein [Planctomycetota bacterium]